MLAMSNDWMNIGNGLMLFSLIQFIMFADQSPWSQFCRATSAVGMILLLIGIVLWRPIDFSEKKK